MLRMSVAAEEYVMIGDNIRLIFLGSSGKHLRIMIDAPKDISIVRSKVLEKKLNDPELAAKMPKYYREEEHPEKYLKKPRTTGTPERRNVSGRTKDSGKRQPIEDETFRAAR